MKKFYTIKTLAVVACAFMANVAFGQNLKVTADGKPVANGDVIEVPYDYEEESYPEFGIFSYSYRWDPHLEVSTTAGTAQLEVTVTSLDNTAGFQICWPMTCLFIEPNGFKTSSGTINTNPQDLQIHKEIVFDEEGAVPTEADGGSIKVTMKSGAETVEVTAKCVLEDRNGVGENFAESNEPTVYYTLEGLKVENPEKGIFVARKGGKAKLVYKK